MPLLHCAPATCHCELDGLAIILDLRSGEYLTLNRTASAMWQALLSCDDRAAAIAAVRARIGSPAVQLEEAGPRIGSPPARLEADFDAFSRSCLERGLACEQAAAAPPVRLRQRCARPSAARALASLLVTTRCLSRDGFARTYARYARLERPRAGVRSGARLAAAERAFAHAELVYVIPTAPRDCLPRSLALWRFLNSVGIDASHRIGVRRFPFGAHAWTQVGERVIFDDPARVAAYTEIARI